MTQTEIQKEKTMKERPSLFSTPMVLAILAGRKTQTRRVVKIPDLIKHPDWYRYIGNSNDMEIPRAAIHYDERLYHAWGLINNNMPMWVIDSYKLKDILWVKEMYYAYGIWLKNGHTKSGKQKWRFFDTTLTGFKYHYVEDPPENVLPNTVREKYGWFKRSSLFMPRKACRIKLEITDIRVERVQDISEEDAKAEGVYFYGWDDYHQTDYKNYSYSDKGMCDDWGVQTAKESYQTLWESINGKGSWGKNPFVWVIKFKRL
jgi:hypothetical protein